MVGCVSRYLASTMAPSQVISPVPFEASSLSCAKQIRSEGRRGVQSMSYRGSAVSGNMIEYLKIRTFMWIVEIEPSLLVMDKP